MQYRPTDAELLQAIADLLEDEVLPATSGPLQHRVRVAGNLCRILEREARLGAAAAEHERALLAPLVPAAPADDLVVLRAALATELRDPATGDAAWEAAAWEALMAVVKDDLAIAKPGHDSWEGV